MDKRFRNYTDWQDTADTLHLFLQMAGKVKLARSYKRPEWAHIRLEPTIQGIGTGIIPADGCNFEIYFNLAQHHVDVQNSLGIRVRIPLLDGLSVADFHRELMASLETIGTPTPINTTPQEFYDPTPFDRDRKHRSYDREAVELFLANLQFAYRSLAGFLAPMRGKVDMPAYWFGTMDLSGNVFSGQPAPIRDRTQSAGTASTSSSANSVSGPATPSQRRRRSMSCRIRSWRTSAATAPCWHRTRRSS